MAKNTHSLFWHSAFLSLIFAAPAAAQQMREILDNGAFQCLESEGFVDIQGKQAPEAKFYTEICNSEEEKDQKFCKEWGLYKTKNPKYHANIMNSFAQKGNFVYMNQGSSYAAYTKEDSSRISSVLTHIWPRGNLRWPDFADKAGNISSPSKEYKESDREKWLAQSKFMGTMDSFEQSDSDEEQEHRCNVALGSAPADGKDPPIKIETGNYNATDDAIYWGPFMNVAKVEKKQGGASVAFIKFTLTDMMNCEPLLKALRAMPNLPEECTPF
jgi:hypothetical protein